MFFSIYWECHHPNWRAYFSRWLKPPTSKFNWKKGDWTDWTDWTGKICLMYVDQLMSSTNETVSLWNLGVPSATWLWSCGRHFLGFKSKWPEKKRFFFLAIKTSWGYLLGSTWINRRPNIKHYQTIWIYSQLSPRNTGCYGQLGPTFNGDPEIPRSACSRGSQWQMALEIWRDYGDADVISYNTCIW